jgi:26S proteasome regulatory subunit N1
MSTKEENPKGANKKNPKQKDEDLSEEDKALKEKLAFLVERLQDEEIELAKSALQNLVQEVKSATTTVTSVPKSLKFLKPHYPTIKDFYTRISNSDFKKTYADFLSVLSMTMGDVEQQESLRYLMEGTLNDYINWGHEYLLHLSGDIAREFNQRLAKQESTDALIGIVEKIVPYLMQHHSEAYAIDLLIEVDKLENLSQFINEHNYQRVNLYLLSCSLYSADQDEFIKTLTTSYHISLLMKRYCDALKAAIRLDDIKLIQMLSMTARTELSKSKWHLRSPDKESTASRWTKNSKISLTILTLPSFISNSPRMLMSSTLRLLNKYINLT